MQGKVEICGVNTSRLKVLKSSETRELLIKSHEGDKEAREKLISGNLRLVLSVIQRFNNRGENPDDLFQVGCIGLVKSIDNFDLKHEVRFSTYAVPVILGEIRRLFREGGAIKVGRTLKELSMRVAREREAFLGKQGREPTVSELAEQMTLPCEQVAEALGAALPPVSLTRHGDEDDGEVQDIPTPPPEEDLTDRLALRQVLTELEPRDRMLITLRYMKRQTQQVTADQLGMTQVQVSRREKVILHQLREKLIS